MSCPDEPARQSAFFGFFFARACFFDDFPGFRILFGGFFARRVRFFARLRVSAEVFGGRFVSPFGVFVGFFDVRFRLFGLVGERRGIFGFGFAFAAFNLGEAGRGQGLPGRCGGGATERQEGQQQKGHEREQKSPHIRSIGVGRSVR